MLDSVTGLVQEVRRPRDSHFQDIETSVAEKFDLAGLSRSQVNCDHSRLDIQWFPDPAHIYQLKKDIDHCRRKDSKVPYVTR